MRTRGWMVTTVTTRVLGGTARHLPGRLQTTQGDKSVHKGLMLLEGDLQGPQDSQKGEVTLRGDSGRDPGGDPGP